VVTCPSCGRENGADARFCSACGASLAATATGETRKTVTVLFADVTGSTELGERLDPESFRRVMARYFDVARTSLERHGGTVEKFIGDAVMAVFGVPTLHEDDALRALRAAVDLRDSLASLNVELERDYGVSLRLRTGVNTGEVVTGTEERLATGDAVNVAARLEQAAQPDEILVGEETRRLASAAIETEPVAPLTLKGKSEPFAAHRLLRVMEGAPAFERRLDAPLVGRGEELARVRAVFDASVTARRCGLVTVLGPPGIGKTRLAREVAVALRDDASVVSGRCLPYGEGITFWPLVEIFREAGAEGELEDALTAGAPEDIFWSVRKALERHARERPLALVIEDIHWAEPTLLDLVEHVATWTRDAPLFLLCLSRPELIDERPAWSGESITLEPLSGDEADQLIESLLGGAELADATRARIREVAEGNPLFVEQLLAMLAEGGDPTHVPGTVQALIAARLDALPDDERAVVERASVVGLEFEWDALGQLAPDGRRPPGALLSGLVRKELIRPHEAIADTFRFRHVLIQQAAYARIPKEQRSVLHERFAGWLDGRGEEFDEIVGYHLEQAYRCLVELGPPTDRSHALGERAATLLAASGKRAEARGDTGAAANLLERAGALLPTDDGARLALMPALGRLLREAARMDEAEVLLADTVERAETAGERRIAAHARVALTDIRFHKTAIGREEVLREIERALAVFTSLDDKSGMARALTLRGKVEFWAGATATAKQSLELAARYASEAGDRAEESESLQYVLSTAVYGPTPAAEGLRRIEEIEGRAHGNSRLHMSCLISGARLEAMQRRFDTARTRLEEARAIGEEHGLDVLLATHHRPAAGFVELLAGAPLSAEHELRAACEFLEQVGELGYLSSAAPILVDALIAQGRDDEAMQLVERWPADRLTVPEDVDAHVGWRRVRARLLARRGDLEEAERLAREATQLAAPTDYIDVHGRACADLADVLRLAGRPDEAATALDEAIRLFEQKGNLASAASARAAASVAIERG
jgi:class 3 adenylate cyclase/tetratricopeptide (TPR) repeat protein